MARSPLQTIAVYHFWPMARSFSLLSNDTANAIIWHPTIESIDSPSVMTSLLCIPYGYQQLSANHCAFPYLANGAPISLLSMITAIAYHMTTDDRIYWFAIGYELPVVLHVNQQFSADYCADYNQANSALLTGRWSLLNAAYLTSNDHDSIESDILSNPFLGEPKVTPVLQSLASKPSHTKVYIQNLKTARSYKMH